MREAAAVAAEKQRAVAHGDGGGSDVGGSVAAAEVVRAGSETAVNARKAAVPRLSQRSKQQKSRVSMSMRALC